MDLFGENGAMNAFGPPPPGVPAPMTAPSESLTL
jgi:hypothetical protein